MERSSEGAGRSADRAPAAEQGEKSLPQRGNPTSDQPPVTDGRPPEQHPKPRWGRCFFIAVALAALIAATASAIWHRPVLTVVADLWVVDRPVAKADAIYILGGGMQSRPFEAVRLYQRGIADRILVPDMEPLPVARAGLVKVESEWILELLPLLGVPESDITLIGERVDSTFAEAEALKKWMSENGASDVVVPTHMFHTRRMEWIMNRQLGKLGKVHPWANASLAYTISDWWQSEIGIVMFQNELVKYLLYRLRY